MFLFNVNQFNNKVAVVTDDDLTLTFAYIDAFNQTIYKLIPKRCLVFCLCQNTIGSLLGYISFLSNSIVPVMLDSKIKQDFLDALISNYRPQYLWLPNNRVSEFVNSQIIFSIHNYSLLKLEDENNSDLHPDLALLLTTSGSTGSSKFVKISYENLRANTEAICAYLSINEYDRPITNLPMWYSYGLSIINTHLIKGACLLLTSKTIIEKRFWDFFKNQNASSLSGVPYTYQILKKLNFSEMTLPSLKTLTQAGGKLNELENKYFSEYALKTGKQFYVMYGQTEATARMSYLPPEYAIKKMGSIGLPLPGAVFSLVGDIGNEIKEANCVGEIVYKGKNVSMGYSKSGNDLIKGNENNGVLYTGDLAKRDEDNFYYIVGRKNRYIKLLGNRVSLDEIETLIKKIISDCACTGKEDRVLIFITDETRLNEIKKYISDKTSIHASVFFVKYCSEIPRTSFGKINYAQLNDL